MSELVPVTVPTAQLLLPVCRAWRHHFHTHSFRGHLTTRSKRRSSCVPLFYLSLKVPRLLTFPLTSTYILPSTAASCSLATPLAKGASVEDCNALAAPELNEWREGHNQMESNNKCIVRTTLNPASKTATSEKTKTKTNVAVFFYVLFLFSFFSKASAAAYLCAYVSN